jgi:hypothetical protein
MFVLQQNRMFWWPVTVEVPSEDTPGELVKETFEVQFENIGLAEWRRIQGELAALSGDEYEARENDHMRRVTRGWRNVVAPDGKTSIPFTPENFDAFWQVSWNRIGLFKAWTEATGGQKARLGN